MNPGRLNKKVISWAETHMVRTKNWNYRLKKHLADINCSHFLDGNVI